MKGILKQMQIKVDNREHALIKLLQVLNKDYNFEIIIERLDLGDISIWNNEEELLLLERKSINDLASSITDGRYGEQSYRLNGHSLHNHNIVYLIEGNISQFTKEIYSGFEIYDNLGLTHNENFQLIQGGTIDFPAKDVTEIDVRDEMDGIKGM